MDVINEAGNETFQVLSLNSEGTIDLFDDKMLLVGWAIWEAERSTLELKRAKRSGKAKEFALRWIQLKMG